MLSAALLAMCVNGGINHEGFSSKVYKDSHGYSVGYGYNLTTNGLGLSKNELTTIRKHGITEPRARKLLSSMCNKTIKSLNEQYTWFGRLPINTQYVMSDMAYNIGVGGLTNFKKTISHIKTGHIALASKEMLRSRWARQVKGRATELSRVLVG